MRKFKKIIVAVILSCMLLVPTAAVASAQDLINPDMWKATFAMFGIDLDDPESIQDALDEIQNGGLSALIGMLGFDISDILAELQEYLFAFQPETTTKEPETTTEPPTTEPTTEAPTYTYPSYEYVPPVYTPETLPPETLPPETLPPIQIYTEPYSTAATFNPVVEDDLSVDSSPTNPVKTAVGIILLVASGIGVIVVVVALKRNRI